MKKNIVIILLVISLIISVRYNVKIYEGKKHIERIHGSDIQHTLGKTLVSVPRDFVLHYLERADEIDAGELKEIIVITEHTYYNSLGVIGYEFSEATQYLLITYKNLNMLLELVEEGAEQEEIDELRNHIIEAQKKSIDTYFKIEEFMQEIGYERGDGLFWYKNMKSEMPEVTKILEEGLW